MTEAKLREEAKEGQERIKAARKKGHTKNKFIIDFECYQVLHFFLTT